MAAIDFPDSPTPDQEFTANNGQTYKWDGTDGKWVVLGGSGVTDLDDLTDVIITAPASNHYLRYNGADWVNQTLPASQVVNTPAGTIAAITVQDAINELDGDIGALTAAAISSTGTGNISATNVQSAIEELEAEKIGSYAAQGGTGAQADVNNIVSISQADYDALGAPNASTLYLIDG